MKQALYDWWGLNALLFKLINAIHFGWYDQLMLLAGEVAEQKRFIFYFIFIALVLLANYGRERMRGIDWTKQDVKNEFALLITLSMGFVMVGFVVGICKMIVKLPRPFVEYYYQPGVVHFVGKYPAQVDYYASFPSAHAAFATFLIVALWPRLKKIKYATHIAIALAVLIGWSRVAVGMNFPADVVFGALIGAGMTLPVRRYVHRMMSMQRVAVQAQPKAQKR